MKKVIKGILDKIDKTKNKSIISIIIGAFISILLGILVGSSVAKYHEEKMVNVVANIAKPIIKLAKQEKQETFKITNINTETSYLFEVRNYEKDEISQIEMEYYIEIISDLNKKIQFELYKDKQKINLVNNRTEKITLTRDDKDTHIYRLDIKYNREKDNLTEDILGDIEIKVHATQKI